MNSDKTVWKDCFERPLEDGEDVIVAIMGKDNRPELHCGVILDLNDSEVEVTYNGWNGEEEYTKSITFNKDSESPTSYPDGVIDSLFKIFN